MKLLQFHNEQTFFAGARHRVIDHRWNVMFSKKSIQSITVNIIQAIMYIDEIHDCNKMPGKVL